MARLMPGLMGRKMLTLFRVKKVLSKIAFLMVLLTPGLVMQAQGITQGASKGTTHGKTPGIDQIAANDPVTQRLFLVGDAGELKDGKHPVCDWLKQHVDWNDSNNVLIYLGDNIYPLGLPSKNSKQYEQARSILDYQVSVVKGKNAKAFFVPGNHDWKRGRRGGLDQVNNQSDYIDSLDLPNVQFLPKNGCPGPVEVTVGEKIVMVFMDSQWWLQGDDRPGAGSGCDCNKEGEVITALKDIISKYPDKLIVLAMHHPFYTYGGHGGYYTIKQHIFPFTDLNPALYIPLPVIGSLYPLSRQVFGNIQDTRNANYKELIQRVENVIKGHKNVVQVAGHEHALQLIQHDSVYYVVSGAGSKTTRIRKGKYSLFAEQAEGLAVIEMHASGKSAIRFYTLSATDLSQTAFTASIPALAPPVTDTLALAKNFPDSVTLVPVPYFKAGRFKRFLLGNNYRTEWTNPIKVKVFDMKGWTPLRRGGGNQTKSLRLENKDGVQYVIRGVEKFITDDALPEQLKGADFVKDLVSDGVSASYPYAALSIPPFANAVNVPHSNPVLVYMPDDPRLGKFRSDYGNTFNLFEEREPGNGKKTYSNDDLVKKLVKDNDNAVDQQKVLRARLMDMFFMDFDRHEDQWRWGAEDNGKGKTYFPVPRDRDQPFFINEGVIPWVVGSAFISPQLQGFRAKARNIKTYNYNARNFDRSYLTEPDEAEWHKMAESVLAVMTDSLIEYALREQPGSVQPYSMESIIAKLKERRKYYIDEMMAYYRFLSQIVTIYGSDKKELFDILRKEDGSMVVTVFKVNKEGEANKKIYERTFKEGETREIRLYGLGEDDRFYEHGAGAHGILVRLIGGPGEDHFENESDAPGGKTRVYDLSTEKSDFAGKGNLRSFLSKDPSVNAVNRLGFKYNVMTPIIDAAFNPDDGLFLGLQFRYTTQGFHKVPYKQLHILSVTHSLATKAYNFKYYFEATDAIGKLDLLVGASANAPNYSTNFFKYGNESVFQHGHEDAIRFYRTRFNLYDAGTQLRANLTPSFSFAVGPVFQYFTMDSSENTGRYIDQTNVNGLDRARLYASKAYDGLRFTATLDSRNNKIMPSSGINWQTNFSAYNGLSHLSSNYAQLNSNLSFFLSFNRRAGVVIASRVGWGKTFGNYEFFQAQYLGGTDNLRGFRKYRFGGDEIVYHNLDLRVKLTDFTTYLFPGSFGFLAFNDIGRVWLKGEDSHQWHDGYGGGLWVDLLKTVVLTASYTRGTDGGLALISWGFQF
ncbi:metallophosphoesterase family protein [Flavitalea flava]